MSCSFAVVRVRCSAAHTLGLSVLGVPFLYFLEENTKENTIFGGFPKQHTHILCGCDFESPLNMNKQGAPFCSSQFPFSLGRQTSFLEVLVFGVFLCGLMESTGLFSDSRLHQAPGEARELGHLIDYLRIKYATRPDLPSSPLRLFLVVVGKDSLYMFAYCG